MDPDNASPSPERRLSKVLTRQSRKSAVNSSTTSLNNSSDALDVPGDRERGGLRASVGSGIDKLRDKARRSHDGDRGSSQDSTSRRLSKLVPKSSKRKKKAAELDNGSIPDLSTVNASGKLTSNNGSPRLGVPGSPVGMASPSKLHFQQSYNASSDSLKNRSTGSSLLTEDSESEPTSARPPLVSRPSHKEYLTFSSPLVGAETIESADDTASKKTLPASQLEGSRDSYTDKQPTSSFAKSDTFPQNQKRPSSVQSNKPSLRQVSTSHSNASTAPSTFITPPTPVLRSGSPTKSNARADPSIEPLDTAGPPLSGRRISSTPTPKDNVLHRRARSATTASKDKVGISTLSPQAEEVRTPGGTLITPSGSSGFFSSVFNATQNAVSQISTTLGGPPAAGNRSRSGTGSSSVHTRTSSGGEEALVPQKEANDSDSPTKVAPKPAVATLGSGNLSLTQLGIGKDGSQDSAATDSQGEASERQPRSRSSTHDGVVASQAEQANAAEAVSTAYGGKPLSGKSVPVIPDNSSRPSSISGTITRGDSTPPRSATVGTMDTDSVAAFGRSGSVRSRLSARKKRSRNSSGATGGAIAAALNASHAALVNPAAGGRRTTGFAVASGKRNKEFHQTFRSVPDDDYLVEDYSAALQREILLQGRLYVSEKHICFSSNILGWVTNLIVSFDEVVSIEKKSTAVIFPNAIVVQTLHAKNVFASFMNRDSTYEMLISIWKVGHPNLKSSQAGYAVDGSATGDRTELLDTVDSSGEQEEDSEGGDEDGANDEDVDSENGRAPSTAASEGAGTVRTLSHAVAQPVATAAETVASKVAEVPSPTGEKAAQDFPGPTAHAPSECADGASHYDKMVLDTTVPAPLGKVYSLTFGPQSGIFMRRFLGEDQKCTDVQLEDDKKGLTEDQKSFSYSYIKPLNASIGPKQTKCIVTQTLDAYDLDKAVSITCSTQTPDVPSGNVFVTKTKYCLMWGPGNTTKILMNCTVEWSGKSWLKGPIEKGAGDGQTQHGKDLATYLKSQLTLPPASRSPAKAPKGKVKGKKKKTELEPPSRSSSALAERRRSTAEAAKESSWGMLEPVHGVCSGVGDLMTPFMTPVGILTGLLLLMTSLWIRAAWSSPSGGVGLAGLGAQGRYAVAYDQSWRGEEGRLWDWLEDRVQLGVIAAGDGNSGLDPSKSQKVLKRSSSGEPGMVERLGGERMDERQVDDAIKVTEERLDALKYLVEKRKDGAKESVE